MSVLTLDEVVSGFPFDGFFSTLAGIFFGVTLCLSLFSLEMTPALFRGLSAVSKLVSDLVGNFSYRVSPVVLLSASAELSAFTEMLDGSSKIVLLLGLPTSVGCIVDFGILCFVETTVSVSSERRRAPFSRVPGSLIGRMIPLGSDVTTTSFGGITVSTFGPRNISVDCCWGSELSDGG